MSTPIFNQLCRKHGNPLKPKKGTVHIANNSITADKIKANAVAGDVVFERSLDGNVIQYFVAERPINDVTYFTPLWLVYPDGLPLE